MTVMGASFILYYLGLFGGVEGPLNPGRIGERLAASGISNRHLLILLISCLMIALSWNWLYNAACRLLGRRMFCTFHQGKKTNCDAQAWRNSEGVYVCGAGHLNSRVRFAAVRKGTISHFVWMMFLIFSGMVFYFS
jgi:hypothetical protein